MSSSKLKLSSVSTMALRVVIIMAAGAAFGQTPQPVQQAANSISIPGSTAAANTGGDPGPSSRELQARIEAQQQQINKLTALVEKLQAMLEPIASARPVLPALPAANAVAVPDPAPAPSPAQASSPAAAQLKSGYAAPRELLPDIGQIGSQVGFFVGGSTNPYKDNNGLFTGGYIDLPWKNVPGGKLSYEITISMQRATTNQPTTSGVNVLVNAALNAYLGKVAPLTSPTSFLTSPLPITTMTQERSTVLAVAPFALKYTVHTLGRFRPYVVAGLGTYVWIGSNKNTNTFNANTALGSLASLPVGSSTLGATLNAILQGSQIGGLVPAAPELAARGVPQGQGNLLFGGQFGGGAEIRITPKLSIGADFRRNQVEGTNGSFNTFAFKQGLHW